MELLIGILVGVVLGFILFKVLKKPAKNTDDLKYKLLQNELNDEKQKSIIENQKLSTKIIEMESNNEKFIREKESEFESREKYIREDAIKKSKSVMLGKMWEQIVPHYRPTDFKFTPSDARFLGSPVDFVVFEGSSESDIKEVVFLEIKTSKSRLNAQQSKLKKLIDSLDSKVVRWETINIPIEMDKSEEL